MEEMISSLFRQIKFIEVKVMIFNKTAAHENDYSFNN